MDDGNENETVFRGGFPSLRNFPFLKMLNLRTIVSFVKGGLKGMSLDLIEFCEHENISLVLVDLLEDKYPSYSSIATILEMVLDKNNLPVYIHCSDGGVSTGRCVMCLRVMQNWIGSSIQEEYYRYVKAGSASPEVAIWSDSFPQTSVNIPEQKPSWFV